MKRVSLLVAGALATCLAVPALAAGDGDDVRQRRADLLGSQGPVATQMPTPLGEDALKRSLTGTVSRLALRGALGASQGEPFDVGALDLPVQQTDIRERFNSIDVSVLEYPLAGLDQAPGSVRAEISRILEAIGPIRALEIPAHAN